MSDTQSWNADLYAKHANFVPVYGEPVLEVLAPKGGEHILDLGCGDGKLTRRIAELGATGLSIDASQEFVGAARALGLDVRLVDARRLDFDTEFDAVFSNAALHWMNDPDAVLAGVRRALRPGGRFVGEFGGHGNVAAIVTAVLAARSLLALPEIARVPWYFPTPEAYAEKLRAHGFTIDSLALIPRPTPLPTDMRGWLDTFAHVFVTDVPPEKRGPLLDTATRLLEPSLRDERGRWVADYVRLRFAAHV